MTSDIDERGTEYRAIRDTPVFIFPGQPTDDEKEYWQALGRFIEAFAGIEYIMFLTLASHAKVSPGMSQAIFSGARVDASVDYIRRIFAVYDPGPENKKEFEELFEHLKFVNDLRNHVAHYPPGDKEGKDRIINNMWRALTLAKTKRMRVSADTLTAATHDVHKISFRLARSNAMAHFLSKKMPPDQLAYQYSHWVISFPIVEEEWLYKPPPPDELNPWLYKRPASQKTKSTKSDRKGHD